MPDLASDFQSSLHPPPPPPPPTTIPRENVRLLIQMLGFPVDDVREMNVTPTQVLVQTVARDDAGAVVMRDGLAAYQVDAVSIVEPSAAE